MLLIPELNIPANCIAKLWFQLFKKQSFQSFEDTCLLKNISAFNLGDKVKLLNGNWLTNKDNLPKEITKTELIDFIGREQELENCSRLLNDVKNNNECLTIQGTGGLGKTKLVKKLALEYSQRGYYHNNITFIDCEHLASYQQFYRFVAGAFDLEDAIDFIDHMTQNPEYQEGERLIIIDNAESLLLLEDKEKILNLISSITNYALILITSRELINIAEEQKFVLRDFVTDEAALLFEQKAKRQFNPTEQEYLRQHILKELLDNNPLAISLVASSLVAGKNLKVLKKELEDNFFALTAKQEEHFSEAEARNVDRKSSIWNSIDYSYRALNKVAKEAIIKLSFFPDGVDLENFKKLTEKDANVRGKTPIKDITIKALQQKSLLQTNERFIRLHPLVTRFATTLVNAELEYSYLKIIFDYNAAFVASLYELHSSIEAKLRLKSSNLFSDQLRNILLCIENLDESFPLTSVSDFIHKVSVMIDSIGAYHEYHYVLNKLIPKFTTESTLKRQIQTTVIQHRYYSGDFTKASTELNRQLPVDVWAQLNTSNEIDNRTYNSASMVYGNEGFSLEEAMYTSKNKLVSLTYASSLYYLGIFNVELTKVVLPDLMSSSIKFNLGMLERKEYDEVFNYTHTKHHVARANLLNLKAKFTSLHKNEIDGLVVVNPYTQGIKYLLYALHHQDMQAAQKLFTLALPALSHIKFSYVETLYQYAQWLQTHHLPEFDTIYQQGLALAQKYYFRFLQHNFLHLLTDDKKLYNEADYPLPDGVDFSEHIQRNIRHCRHRNKK